MNPIAVEEDNATIHDPWLHLCRCLAPTTCVNFVEGFIGFNGRGSPDTMGVHHTSLSTLLWSSPGNTQNTHIL